MCIRKLCCYEWRLNSDILTLSGGWNARNPAGSSFPAVVWAAKVFQENRIFS